MSQSLFQMSDEAILLKATLCRALLEILQSSVILNSEIQRSPDINFKVSTELIQGNISAANKELDFQTFHIQTESNYLRDKTRLKPTRILIQLMQKYQRIRYI